jgi:hypothetical protein
MYVYVVSVLQLADYVVFPKRPLHVSTFSFYTSNEQTFLSLYVRKPTSPTFCLRKEISHGPLMLFQPQEKKTFVRAVVRVMKFRFSSTFSTSAEMSEPSFDQMSEISTKCPKHRPNVRNIDQMSETSTKCSNRQSVWRSNFSMYDSSMDHIQGDQFHWAIVFWGAVLLKLQK